MNQKKLVVKTTDLLRDALGYMKLKCNIKDETGQGQVTYRQCMQVWARHFAGREMEILVEEFGRECIDGLPAELGRECIDGSLEECGRECIDGSLAEREFAVRQPSGFWIGGEEFTCRLLDLVDREGVTGGFFYLFHAPEAFPDTEDGREDAYYIQSWQIALLDAARCWLQRYLCLQLSQGIYLSPSFGPGFYGMELEAVGAMVHKMNGEQVGVTLGEDGLMRPAQSVAGIFLTARGRFVSDGADCLNCMGTGNCQMCQFFRAKPRK